MLNRPAVALCVFCACNSCDFITEVNKQPTVTPTCFRRETRRRCRQTWEWCELRWDATRPTRCRRRPTSTWTEWRRSCRPAARTDDDRRSRATVAATAHDEHRFTKYLTIYLCCSGRIASVCMMLHFKVGMLNKLRSCYNRCIKILFGYSRRDSVTSILFNLGLPSFDTLMKNASTELLQQPPSCAYVSAICVLTVITVVQHITLNFLSVFFIFLYVFNIFSVIVQSVCLSVFFYGPRCLKLKLMMTMIRLS